MLVAKEHVPPSVSDSYPTAQRYIHCFSSVDDDDGGGGGDDDDEGGVLVLTA